MGLVAEGHGFSVVHGAISLSQNPITVEIPGWTKAELARTTQANTGGHTAQVATLKKFEDFTHQFPYDPADYAKFQADAGASSLHVITYPDNTTLSIYAAVKSVGNISQETDGRPVFDVTFLVTNLKASVETLPSYSGS